MKQSSELISIEDLGRPVTPSEYIVVVSKTAISIELLFKTTRHDAANEIMEVMLTGMAERLRRDLGTFVNDVKAASNQMAFAGFFRSPQFLALIAETIADGQPTEDSFSGFLEYVADKSQEAVQNAPPPGTRLN